MKLHKILNDNVNISDSLSNNNIRGFVRLTDKKTGKIIFAKHNTILNPGKNSVFNWVLEYMCKDIGLTTNEDKKYYKFNSLVFGTGRDITTLTGFETLSNITPVIIDSKFYYTYSLNNSNVEVNSSERYIKFSTDVSQETAATYNLSELVITMKEILADGSLKRDSNSVIDYEYYNSLSDDDPLFSRISFDPIPVGADSKFLLDYYIYF